MASQMATTESAQQTEFLVETIHVTGQTLQQGTPTRLPLTAREIPQSISEISTELMNAANMLNINDVMMNIPGVNVTLYDSQRPLYFARGFQITDFQVDHIPTYSGSTNQEYDTALYERIEVIRGANGLFSGVGSPSATVNLLRKRPGYEPRASLSASLGSWQMRRAVADVSTPLNNSGTVRSRFVLAGLDTNNYLDRYQEKKLAGLIITEADISDRTTLTLGVQGQDNKPEGSTWGSIPIFATDGSLAKLPVSTSYAPDWTHWQRQTYSLFTDLSHDFDNNWRLKAAVNRTQGDVSSLRVYATGFPDKATGNGLTLLASVGAAEDSRTSLDLYLTGSYLAFGQEHDLIAGLTLSELEARTDIFSSIADWSYQVPDAWNYDGSAPMPEYSNTGAYRQANTKQRGFYLANRFRLHENWSLVAGARISSWQTATENFDAEGQYTSTTGAYKVSDELTPYVGLIWDLSQQHSLYLSYTDIFNPQNYKDKNNNLLAPVVGKNIEFGIKSSVFDGRLALNAALFNTRQDNYAVRDFSQPDNSLPDGSSAFLGVNGTESKGFEISSSGRLMAGWMLNAGYTYVDTKRHGNDQIWTNLPKHSAQLSSHYQFSGALANLMLGGGFNWQGETVGYGVKHPIETAGVTFRQKAYVLTNLYASWQLTDRIGSTFSVTNLFDKVYWTNIDFANYGKPRQLTLSVRWQY
ncbi:TonB-dependent siderophore receptor [Alkalimonas mucilaginosa]|uniref:TonB-dependent siderophore receptor n=1 Tax=Alkalimonas mucilaginosa TaxID=3057676 RepID=A0ABU7JGQ1_9GAMM|nr:TonB-dependent siderophore receptor [Alkalimonas sp. MEB004]MEE2024852.1 TonB-dependent siderophore receptor [Alkalimonas sp. MEB004]